MGSLGTDLWLMGTIGSNSHNLVHIVVLFWNLSVTKSSWFDGCFCPKEFLPLEAPEVINGPGSWLRAQALFSEKHEFNLCILISI